MKENVTSKEELLEKAKEVLLQEGVDALSIRRLAKECNISVGVFYNYFETKADLIFAIVSEFWQSLIVSKDLVKQDNICGYVDTFYSLLVNHLEEYEKTWLIQMSLLNSSERQKGKELEQQCFSNIFKQMIILIEKDQSIQDDVFNEVLTKEAFAHFILMNIIAMAKGRCHDAGGFIEILKRVLYK